eukprot:gene9171-10144_t
MVGIGIGIWFTLESGNRLEITQSSNLTILATIMRRFVKAGPLVLLAGSRFLRFSFGTGGPGRLAHSASNASFSNQDESYNSVSTWLKDCFKNKSYLPIFSVNGDNITVLREPCEFYEILKSKAAVSNKRIVLASLYLGTGHLEQDLVNTIHERSRELAANSNEFQIKILLEHTRGSRGKKNSRTMLLPVLQEFPNNVSISLYHTPKLRGLLRAIVPERFNETISAMHLKVYIFDDTLVMSGANLSNDYFTNRQDRCIVFEDCRELCDYFHELVNTVSSFSLQLSPQDTTHVHNNLCEHPYLGDNKKYINEARKKIKDFMQKYSNHGNLMETVDKMLNSDKGIVSEESNTKYEAKDCLKSVVMNDIENKRNNTTLQISNKSECNNEQRNMENMGNSDLKHKASQKYNSVKDTFVIPLIQMYPLGVTDDEEITSNLLRHAPSQSKIFLATAYFNLTRNYWNRILKSRCNDVDVVMAHPKANGFFEAPGVAGGIPHAYTLIAKQCYRDVVKLKQQDRISFWEYLRPGWTFHGKGLWTQVGPSLLPYLTMFGSSNFGNRSAYRDLEAQILLVTRNETLSHELEKEKNNLKDYSTFVGADTYRNNDRRTPLWVFLIRTIMKTFF